MAKVKTKNSKSGKKGAVIKKTVTMVTKGKTAKVRITYNKKTKKTGAKIIKVTKTKKGKGKGAKVSKTIPFKIGKGKKAKVVKVKATYNSKKNKVSAKIVKTKKTKWVNKRGADVRKTKPTGAFKHHKYKPTKNDGSFLRVKKTVLKVKRYKEPPASGLANEPGGERAITRYSKKKKGTSSKKDVRNAWRDGTTGHSFNSPSRAAKLATLYNNRTKEKLQLQFNPTSVPYNAGATYAEAIAPGMNYPIFQYVHGNSTKFEIELFYYDRPYTGQIDNARDFLFDLLPPQKNQKPWKKHKVKGAYVPATFKFVYGYFKRTLVLESLKVNDEWLDSKGRPILTRFTLSVIQVRDH